jgi:hypothetical protein
MRGRSTMALLGAALVLGACGSSTDVATGGTETTSGAAPAGTSPAPAAGGAAAMAGPGGAAALDCPSGTAAGLTFSEAPPAPGTVRAPAAAVVDALRAQGVVPEAARAVEALGRGLQRRWSPRTGAPAAEVASGLGPDASVDVSATVDTNEPGTPADVVVSRGDRAVVIVSVSERQPGYWGVDGLWACSEEVPVQEYPE